MISKINDSEIKTKRTQINTVQNSGKNSQKLKSPDPRIFKTDKRIPNLLIDVHKDVHKPLYYVRCTINGKQFKRAIKSINPTDTIREKNNKVQDFIEALKSEQNGEIIRKKKPGRLTFSDYVAEYADTRPKEKQTFLNNIKTFSLNEMQNDRAAQAILHGNFKDSTKRNKALMVNRFYKWLRDTKSLRIELPFKDRLPTNKQPRQRTATDEELRLVIDSIKARNDYELLLFTLLQINYGVRVSTAHACTPETLRTDGYHFFNVKCDRPYKYVIPATSPETDSLFRETAASGTLWKSTLCALKSRLQTLLHKFGKDENGEYLSPHSLRHTFATNALRSGVAPETVAQLLDHNSIDTTLNVYARYSQNQLGDAVKRAQVQFT